MRERRREGAFFLMHTQGSSEAKRANRVQGVIERMVSENPTERRRGEKNKNKYYLSAMASLGCARKGQREVLMRVQACVCVRVGAIFVSHQEKCYFLFHYHGNKKAEFFLIIK